MAKRQHTWQASRRPALLRNCFRYEIGSSGHTTGRGSVFHTNVTILATSGPGSAVKYQAHAWLISPVHEQTAVAACTLLGTHCIRYQSAVYVTCTMLAILGTNGHALVGYNLRVHGTREDQGPRRICTSPCPIVNDIDSRTCVTVACAGTLPHRTCRHVAPSKKEGKRSYLSCH
jgi:hypothetical protein